jgi:hypothetical protein
MTNEKLAKVFSLVSSVLLLKRFCGEHMPSLDINGCISFPWKAKDRDDAYLIINFLTSTVQLLSYMESGHNRDWYDRQVENLSVDRALQEVTNLHEFYDRKALEHAKRMIKSNEEKQINDEARQMVNNFLHRSESNP